MLIRDLKFEIFRYEYIFFLENIDEPMTEPSGSFAVAGPSNTSERRTDCPSAQTARPQCLLILTEQDH